MVDPRWFHPLPKKFGGAALWATPPQFFLRIVFDTFVLPCGSIVFCHHPAPCLFPSMTESA
jgi:hypothetical protein